MDRVKNQIGLKTIVEIHESNHAEIIKDSVDIIQITVFLTRRNDLIFAAAKLKKY